MGEFYIFFSIIIVCFGVVVFLHFEYSRMIRSIEAEVKRVLHAIESKI